MNPTIKAILYVLLLSALIGSGVFLNKAMGEMYNIGSYIGYQVGYQTLQMNCQKSVNNAYSQGVADQNQAFNDYMAESLLKGEVRIKYQSTDTDTGEQIVQDLILIPKNQ